MSIVVSGLRVSPVNGVKLGYIWTSLDNSWGSDHLMKNHNFFSNVMKDIILKELALESDLSCIIRKDIFPEDMMLFFTQKMKDDLPQKK